MAVDFLPFATDPGANVLPQADYAVLPARDDGFVAGIARSEELNKVWRQSAFIMAGLANFVNQSTGQDVLDDGDLDAFIALLTRGIQSTAIGQAQVFNTNGNFTVPDNIYRVRARLWGAGGGGSGTNGGSGGAGGYVESFVDVTPGDIMPVVVGTGGAGASGGAVAGSGTDSTFSTLTAGGGGGSGVSSGSGTGGSATGGDILNIEGTDGTDIGTDTDAWGGFTGGGGGQGGSPLGGTVAGANGKTPGGGGGAASSVALGGDGGDGLVIIEY
jgi:hypothetical protein